MAKTTKKKIIPFSLIIFGVFVLITEIMMVQTGFATFDDDEPRVGAYIGGAGSGALAMYELEVVIV
tara:strand:- start:1695 stop:1892 length:198 start_codon:yes stop_codon:yes gene_type:complete